MSRKKQKKVKEQTPEIKKAEVPTSDDGRPDYGGLPQRDLKKNLGCG